MVVSPMITCFSFMNGYDGVVAREGLRDLRDLAHLDLGPPVRHRARRPFRTGRIVPGRVLLAGDDVNPELVVPVARVRRHRRAVRRAPPWSSGSTCTRSTRSPTRPRRLPAAAASRTASSASRTWRAGCSREQAAPAGACACCVLPVRERARAPGARPISPPISSTTERAGSPVVSIASSLLLRRACPPYS